jgi:hypothetical protein
MNFNRPGCNSQGRSHTQLMPGRANGRLENCPRFRREASIALERRFGAPWRRQERPAYAASAFPSAGSRPSSPSVENRAGLHPSKSTRLPLAGGNTTVGRRKNRSQKIPAIGRKAGIRITSRTSGTKAGGGAWINLNCPCGFPQRQSFQYRRPEKLNSQTGACRWRYSG